MSDRMAVLEGLWVPDRTNRRWDLRRLRRIGSEWDILGIAALTLAWFGLVAWTAAGSESWQAQVCADLTHQPRGCDGVRGKKDENRIVPVAPEARIAP